jgi:hypothetical protein
MGKPIFETIPIYKKRPIAINKKLMERMIIFAITINFLSKAFRNFTEGLKNLQTIRRTSSRKPRNKKRKKRRKLLLLILYRD